MSQSTNPQEPKPSWPGGSLALFILGLCILIPTGLCTAIAIVVYPLGIVAFLIVGGIPAAMGAALVWGALRARRR